MSGLDKIKARILEEAEAAARDILDKAGTEADRILREAGEEADAASADTAAGAAHRAQEYERRAESAADMRRKQAVLSAKQEVIRGVLQKAYKEILDLDDEKYFEMMEKLLEQNVFPQAGEIRFNRRDLERMPEGFPGRIRTIAAAKGGSLTLSDAPLETDGGFLLVYGGIEENCSFEALFYSSQEALQDKVQKFLFQ